jgi:hypothetical protein
LNIIIDPTNEIIKLYPAKDKPKILKDAWLHCGTNEDDCNFSTKLLLKFDIWAVQVCGPSHKPHSIPACHPAKIAPKNNNKEINSKKTLFLC